MKTEAGHNFLARLGKTRLRPGGIIATKWLIEQAEITSDTKILEVACNMGTTMIELAKNHQCEIVGVDLSQAALEKATQNIAAHHLEHLISVQKANAVKLPFPDQSFDFIINEAMLTMLDNNAKKRAVAEYFRILKPGGMLLTHDICLTSNNLELVEKLSQTINVHVHPQIIPAWEATFSGAGFSTIQIKTGNMSLMSPIGMIKDEGLGRTFTIIKNGLKAENRSTFKKMFNLFKTAANDLQYIAVASKKAKED
ncbi:class I SAM-dependent methyltransferase [Isobaculum melis]|uniref:Methyltransferase domain-containing protein n=1 Tax=Isobaculum melis TaxID=142588 RepID=A0A1H9QWI9_9LACT|nr:class I SAM-dependent methyltransferase [Isobaculum melis]SER64757.1 Methyltransferase domain-containing protein [Isobaculum melis]